jgi:hypothetical protein
MEIILIVLSVVMVALVIILAILLYHMFLAYNEVNKRLLALASEAIINQRITQEEIDTMIKRVEEKFSLKISRVKASKLIAYKVKNTSINFTTIDDFSKQKGNYQS